MIDIDRVVSFTRKKIEDLEWGTAAQLVIIQRETVLVDLAIGSDPCGRPIDPDSMFAIYCATKPLVSLAIADLIQRAELSLNDQLGDVVDGPLHPALQAITIEALLTHRAGLHHPSINYLLNPAPVRDRLARLTEPIPIPESNRGIYSEYAAWHLLGLAIEALTDGHFDVYATEILRQRYGVNEIAFRPSSAQLSRLRLNVDIATHTPLYWEAAETNIQDARAAQGGYASMRQLATLSDVVRRRVHSVPPLDDWFQGVRGSVVVGEE